MNKVYILVAVVVTATCALSQPFRCPRRDDCLKTGCLYQNAGNCSQFWQCDLAGRAFLKECPSGLQFNERVRVCDWPPSPTCGGGEATEPTTTEEVSEETTTESQTEAPTTTTERPTEAPTTTTTEDPSDNTVRPADPDEFECPAGDDCRTTGCLYQNHNNCSQFWQCDLSRRAFLKECPSGLEFNENNRVCDWPPSPTCRRVPPSTTTTTTTTPVKPEEPTTTTTEQAVEETTTAEPTTAEPITEEPTPVAPGDFNCPRGDNCLTTGCLYQNHRNCSQFWQCDLAGRAFLKECPNGLQFNERVRVCDWPPSPTCRPEPDQL